ncbi:hypothetical protein EAI35_11515 [Enterobacter bugandensis]|uniref:hypothetical protein n=1 Tax=Enterobacter bugandensis TaxID=881260 RepID=UPI0010A34CB7|nr:hypothetical protein [Enterobacter bugandensis]THE54532.1 hypothetical protein EAI35_11515 [Enterobacter bugandensis]
MAVFHFFVIEQGGKLITSWKIVDAKWIELFGIDGLKKQYKLTLMFNEAKNRVSYREKSIDIGIELSIEVMGLKKFNGVVAKNLVLKNSGG